MKTLIDIAIIVVAISLGIVCIALVHMFIGYYFRELIEDPEDDVEVEESSDEGVE